MGDQSKRNPFGVRSRTVTVVQTHYFGEIMEVEVDTGERKRRI